MKDFEIKFDAEAIERLNQLEAQIMEAFGSLNKYMRQTVMPNILWTDEDNQRLRDAINEGKRSREDVASKRREMRRSKGR